ncbi:MAG: class E sortase [Candidatus Saccharimonas sp.]
MLALKQHKKRGFRTGIISAIAIVFMSAGLYVLSLTVAPSLAPLIVQKPITVSALPAPEKTENRIIIPKIGVNIHYDKGVAALDRGAQWRHPERGNPVDGSNFIIAAHRFSIQPTPLGTIEKSPFYSIDKLVVGDKIIVDYEGARYAYEITATFNVTPNQTEIEAASEEPKLTLYSCELDGSAGGRVVINAKPLGKVALGDQKSDTN